MDHPEAVITPTFHRLKELSSVRSEVGVIEEDVRECVVVREAAKVESGKTVLPGGPLLLLLNVGVIQDATQDVEYCLEQVVLNHHSDPFTP